jgi:hypothetical protein
MWLLHSETDCEKKATTFRGLHVQLAKGQNEQSTVEGCFNC